MGDEKKGFTVKDRRHFTPAGEVRGFDKDDALRLKAMEEFRALNDKFPQDRPTVKDLVDHIDHVKKIVGIDYVGIGTDFDGGGGVVGCDDVSGMIHVTEELIRRGYTDKEIEKIWGGNFMRVFNKVKDLAKAAS